MDSGLPRCTEPTVVLTIPLPDGQKWAWIGDCNVVALSPTLNIAEREEAIMEVSVAWRRSFLRVVDAETEVPDDLQAPSAS